MPGRSANPKAPGWLAALFWALLVQLPFELPKSVVPIPGMVVTHLEITLLVLIGGYLAWRLLGAARTWRGKHRRRFNETGQLSLTARTPTLSMNGRDLLGRPETWVIAWLCALVLAAALAPGLHAVSIRFILRSAAIASLFWISRDLHGKRQPLPLGMFSITATLFVALAAVVALAGILEGSADRMMEPILRPFRPRPSFDDGIWRLTSTFSHANQTAAWLAMSLPLCIAFALSDSEATGMGGPRTDRRRTVRFLALTAVFGLVLWALLSTLGRGGITAGLMITVAMLGWCAMRSGPRRFAIVLLLVVSGVCTTRLLTSPGLRARLHLLAPGPAFAASYECPAKLALRSGESTGVAVRLTNVGFVPWPAASIFPVRLSYHLYDLDGLDGAPEEGPRADLAKTIRKEASIVVRAPLVAPPRPGLYLVAWDLVRESVIWFSHRGVLPGLTLLRVLPAENDSMTLSDPRDQDWYDAMPPAERLAWLDRLAKDHARQTGSLATGAGTTSPLLDPERVPRTLLWKSALELFRERPLTGWGPDTFRFLYTRKLQVARANTDLQAHDLYLELLATGGLVCLLSWLALLGAIFSKLWAAARGGIGSPLHWGWGGVLGVLSLHGLVDSFFGSYELMGFFWISAGALVASLPSSSPEAPATNPRGAS